MKDLFFSENRPVVAAFTAGMFFAACVCGQDDRSPLRLEKEIALAGVEGRIDHCSVDVPGKRIFIAALGNGTVEVVDLAKGERTAEIRGLKEPQGLYYDDATSRLYVASAGDGTLRLYEGKDLTLQRPVEFGDDADNVRYDEKTRQIWVGYGSGGLGVVAAGEKAGEISLGSHPESFQLEHTGSRVFVNVPKEFGVAVVDRAKHAVISKWGLDWAFANYPMALDERDGRLYVGCRLPARLVILDTNSGQVVAKLPIVGDTDDVFFDPTRQFIYVIGGDGAGTSFGCMTRIIMTMSEGLIRPPGRVPDYSFLVSIGCLWRFHTVDRRPQNSSFTKSHNLRDDGTINVRVTLSGRDSTSRATLAEGRVHQAEVNRRAFTSSGLRAFDHPSSSGKGAY